MVRRLVPLALVAAVVPLHACGSATLFSVTPAVDRDRFVDLPSPIHITSVTGSRVLDRARLDTDDLQAIAEQSYPRHFLAADIAVPIEVVVELERRKVERPLFSRILTGLTLTVLPAHHITENDMVLTVTAPGGHAIRREVAFNLNRHYSLVHPLAFIPPDDNGIPAETYVRLETRAKADYLGLDLPRALADEILRAVLRTVAENQRVFFPRGFQTTRQ